MENEDCDDLQGNSDEELVVKACCNLPSVGEGEEVQRTTDTLRPVCNSGEVSSPQGESEEAGRGAGYQLR
ncbi:hypothetical protein A2U01_0097736, partial [Trifolium medium]|nr:hypothetical protein [Trifolium medium]